MSKFIQKIKDAWNFYSNMEITKRLSIGLAYVGYRKGFFFYPLLLTDKPPRTKWEKIKTAWNLAEFWTVKADGIWGYSGENTFRKVHCF